MQRIPNKANEYLYNRLFVDLEWEKMKYREEKSLPNEGHQLWQHTAYSQLMQEAHCSQVLFSFHRAQQQAEGSNLLVILESQNED